MDTAATVRRVSASGTARAWIEALPTGTWFRSAAVPGEHHVVRNVLSRLMAADRPIIGRLGGFEFNTLGPGTTAVNKLLAQTEMSESGDLGSIRGRARDVYDLACIAKSADDFEGHIGRDSKALLWGTYGTPVTSGVKGAHRQGQQGASVGRRVLDGRWREEEAGGWLRLNQIIRPVHPRARGPCRGL